jgi:mannose-6-phosphate isomerase-like protein (cupin superfamily)
MATSASTSWRWNTSRERAEAVAAPIDLDELPHSEHSHEFVGADHGDVPFCLILVHSAPGVGPRLHRHPYAEVFVVESGEATFQLGDQSFLARQGQVIVGPPDIPHGFTNTGRTELRLTAIHGAARFDTRWVGGEDPAWASPPPPRRRG